MRKFTIPTWFTIGWLGFVVFLAIFGPLMPLRSWEYVYENSLGVVPFSKGHLLGTDTNGFDLLSSVVNGARLSLFISITAVGIGGLIGSVLGITAAYVRGKFDTLTSTQCCRTVFHGHRPCAILFCSQPR